MPSSHDDANFQVFFDVNPDPIVISRVTDGQIVLVNREFERTTGYSGSEALGRTGVSLNLWPEPSERERCFRELQAGCELRNLDMTFQMKDGSRRPFLLSATTVYFNGEPCTMTVARDLSVQKQIQHRLEESERQLRAEIVERKEIESQLREAEANLRLLFESSGAAAGVARVRDGVLVDVNHEFERLYGVSRDVAIGRSGVELGLYANIRTAEAFRCEVLKSEHGVRHFEIPMNKAGGEVAWTLCSGAVVQYQGEACIVTIAHDVTALKESERRLRQEIAERQSTERSLRDSEALFRTTIEASSDAITVNRASDGAYLMVNEGFVKMSGYRREEAIGRSAGAMSIWVEEKGLRRFVQRLRNERVIPRIEFDARRKNGEIVPCEASAVLAKIRGEDCIITIVRDISELKRYQGEILAAQKAALAASRAKSEFLSSMSHEIRTPMNAIVGMAEIVGRSDLTVDQRRYVDIIKANCDSLLTLINDILDLAKIESGRMTLAFVDFDLEELVEKVAETMAVRAHEKGLELAVRVAPEVPRNIVGDPLRLRQILVNLVGNAIKFTEKGYVCLEVGVAGQMDRASESSPDNDAPIPLRFAITDTGIGIPKNKVDLIFSSFEQADSSTTRQYGGSGLGLAIVRRLVDLYAGEISVESSVGVGSRFTFTVALGPTGRAYSPSSVELTGLRGARILLIGEVPINRQIVRELLAPVGAEVVEAASYGEAEALAIRARDSGVPYKLLLVDCKQGGIDGLAAISRLRQLSDSQQSALPVILMLPSDDLASRLATVREIGISTYLVKPVRRRDLMDAIKRSLGDSRSVISQPEVQRGENPNTLPPLHVLIADDSPVNRLLIREYLAATPLTLDEADNGQIAGERFAASHYDLVIMDMRMPVMDGYEAVRAIRAWEQQHCATPAAIIALTASVLSTDVDRCLQAGCDRHLSKPVKRQELLDMIAAVVATRP